MERRRQMSHDLEISGIVENMENLRRNSEHFGSVFLNAKQKGKEVERTLEGKVRKIEERQEELGEELIAFIGEQPHQTLFRVLKRKIPWKK